MRNGKCSPCLNRTAQKRSNLPLWDYGYYARYSAGLICYHFHVKNFENDKNIIHLTNFKSNVQGSVHHKYIPFDIFPTRCNFTQVICFWKTGLHVSGGISTHHQEHIQLNLQYLVLVKPLLLPAAIAAGSSNGLTSTRYCKYSCMCSWWWVEIPPETCRPVFQKQITCVKLRLVGNISKGMNFKSFPFIRKKMRTERHEYLSFS